MITTSFARLYDNNTEMPAPLGWASATPTAAQNNDPEYNTAFDPENSRSGSLSQKFDRESRLSNGASEDGQLGEVILDSLFSIVFPGLASIFSPLSALDAVDLYDQTRQAFRRTARPALPRRAVASGPATRGKFPAKNRPAPMVQSNRRTTSGPALMMG